MLIFANTLVSGEVEGWDVQLRSSLGLVVILLLSPLGPRISAAGVSESHRKQASVLRILRRFSMILMLTLSFFFLGDTTSLDVNIFFASV